MTKVNSLLLILGVVLCATNVAFLRADEFEIRDDISEDLEEKLKELKEKFEAFESKLGDLISSAVSDAKRRPAAPSDDDDVVDDDDDDDADAKRSCGGCDDRESNYHKKFMRAIGAPVSSPKRVQTAPAKKANLPVSHPVHDILDIGVRAMPLVESKAMKAFKSSLSRKDLALLESYSSKKRFIQPLLDGKIAQDKRDTKAEKVKSRRDFDEDVDQDDQQQMLEDFVDSLPPQDQQLIENNKSWLDLLREAVGKEKVPDVNEPSYELEDDVDDDDDDDVNVNDDVDDDDDDDDVKVNVNDDVDDDDDNDDDDDTNEMKKRQTGALINDPRFKDALDNLSDEDKEKVKDAFNQMSDADKALIRDHLSRIGQMIKAQQRPVGQSDQVKRAPIPDADGIARRLVADVNLAKKNGISLSKVIAAIKKRGGVF